MTVDDRRSVRLLLFLAVACVLVAITTLRGQQASATTANTRALKFERYLLRHPFHESTFDLWLAALADAGQIDQIEARLTSQVAATEHADVGCILLARVYARAFRLDRARQAIDAIAPSSAWRSDPELALFRARLAVNAGDHELAKRELELALPQCDEADIERRVRYEIGRLAHLMNDSEAARDALLASVRVEPSTFGERRAGIRQMAKLGYLEDALSEYRRLAAETTPRAADPPARFQHHCETLVAIARLQQDLGRVDDAIDSYWELFPYLGRDHWLAKEAIHDVVAVASAASRDKVDDVIARIQAELDAPEQSSLERQLLWIEFSICALDGAGRRDAAIDRARAAITRFPHDAALSALYGDLLVAPDHDELAIAEHERWLREFPSDVECRQRFADRLTRAGRVAAARHQWQRLFALASGDRDRQRLLLDHWIELDAHAGARPTGTAALFAELIENSIESLLTSGANAFEIRSRQLRWYAQRADARLDASYLALIESAAGDARRLEQIADVAVEFGHFDRAAQVIERALALEPATSDGFGANSRDRERLLFMAAEIAVKSARHHGAAKTLAEHWTLQFAQTSGHRRLEIVDSVAKSLTSPEDRDQLIQSLRQRVNLSSTPADQPSAIFDRLLLARLFADRDPDAFWFGGDPCVNCLRPLIERVPPEVAALEIVAARRERTGRQGSAIRAVERLLDLDPERRRIHLAHLARLQMRVGDHDAARACCDELRALAGSNVKRLVAVGRLLQRLARSASDAAGVEPSAPASEDDSNLDAAARCFELALYVDPESTDALIEFGRLHIERGSVERGLSCYLRAIDIARRRHRRDRDPVRQLVSRLDQDLATASEVMTLLERCHRQNPDDPTLSLLLAHRYVARRDYRAAATEFEHVVAGDPDDVEAWQAMILAYSHAKQGVQADRALARLRREMPQHDRECYAITMQLANDREADGDRDAAARTIAALSAPMARAVGYAECGLIEQALAAIEAEPRFATASAPLRAIARHREWLCELFDRRANGIATMDERFDLCRLTYRLGARSLANALATELTDDAQAMSGTEVGALVFDRLRPLLVELQLEPQFDEMARLIHVKRFDDYDYRLRTLDYLRDQPYATHRYLALTDANLGELIEQRPECEALLRQFIELGAMAVGLEDATARTSLLTSYERGGARMPPRSIAQLCAAKSEFARAQQTLAPVIDGDGPLDVRDALTAGLIEWHLSHEEAALGLFERAVLAPSEPPPCAPELVALDSRRRVALAGALLAKAKPIPGSLLRYTDRLIGNARNDNWRMTRWQALLLAAQLAIEQGHADRAESLVAEHFERVRPDERDERLWFASELYILGFDGLTRAELNEQLGVPASRRSAVSDAKPDIGSIARRWQQLVIRPRSSAERLAWFVIGYDAILQGQSDEALAVLAQILPAPRLQSTLLVERGMCDAFARIRTVQSMLLEWSASGADSTSLDRARTIAIVRTEQAALADGVEAGLDVLADYERCSPRRRDLELACLHARLLARLQRFDEARDVIDAAKDERRPQPVSAFRCDPTTWAGDLFGPAQRTRRRVEPFDARVAAELQCQLACMAGKLEVATRILERMLTAPESRHRCLDDPRFAKLYIIPESAAGRAPAVTADERDARSQWYRKLLGYYAESVGFEPATLELAGHQLAVAGLRREAHYVEQLSRER